MLSYIRRAQRRRMYERANSDSGQYNTKEPESPSSPVNSSAANGQTSEGFHFYATVKKHHSLPEVGGKNSTPKTRLDEQRAEKLNDSKTIEVAKKATSEKASHWILYKPLSMTVQEMKQDETKNVAENCHLVKHLLRDGDRQLKLHFASSDYVHGKC